MNEILKYIHNNIKAPLLASDVANKFGYSKWYFCDKFKSFTGKTFVEYVRHYRIQLSALEILSGSKIIDTAINYGYESISGFNKAFLKEYGCNPTEYIKQAQESQLYYEKRRTSMFQLSDRCAMLRDEAMNKKEYQCLYSVQRNVYHKIGAINAKEKGLPNIEVIESGIENTLKCFHPIIIPGEIIVGFNFSDIGNGECLYPENNEDGIKILKENGISDADIKRYFEVKSFADCEWVDAEEFTPAEKDSEYEWASIGRCIDSNHSVIGYESILKKGFVGMLEEISEAEKKNGDLPLYRATKKYATPLFILAKNMLKRLKNYWIQMTKIIKKRTSKLLLKSVHEFPGLLQHLLLKPFNRFGLRT